MSLVALQSSSSDTHDSPNPTGSPERMLLLAVLERAILDYVGNDHKEAQASQEWLFGDEGDLDNVEPFTFIWICGQLDLNAKNVADMIRAMPKRGSHRIAPWYFTKHYAAKKRANLN